MTEELSTGEIFREVLRRLRNGYWFFLFYTVPIALGWWLILNDIHDQGWMLGMVIGPIAVGFVIAVVASQRENPNKAMPPLPPGRKSDLILYSFVIITMIPIIGGGTFVYDYVFHYLTKPDVTWQYSDAYPHFESIPGMLIVFSIWMSIKYLWKRRKAKLEGAA
jgi:hypothetical protein